MFTFAADTVPGHTMTLRNTHLYLYLYLSISAQDWLLAWHAGLEWGWSWQAAVRGFRGKFYPSNTFHSRGLAPPPPPRSAGWQIFAVSPTAGILHIFSVAGSLTNPYSCEGCHRVSFVIRIYFSIVIVCPCLCGCWQCGAGDYSGRGPILLSSAPCSRQAATGAGRAAADPRSCTAPRTPHQPGAGTPAKLAALVSCPV